MLNKSKLFLIIINNVSKCLSVFNRFFIMLYPAFGLTSPDVYNIMLISVNSVFRV